MRIPALLLLTTLGAAVAGGVSAQFDPGYPAERSLYPAKASALAPLLVADGKRSQQVRTFLVTLKTGADKRVEPAGGGDSVELAQTEAMRQASQRSALMKSLRARGARILNVYEHAFSGFAAELDQASVDWLRADPRVALIEQDVEFALQSSAGEQLNQPAGSLSWGLDRIDQRSGIGDGRFRYQNQGERTHVYVIDSGIRGSHREFLDASGRSRVVPVWNAVAGNALDTTEDTCAANAYPQLGHGTSVASVVGGLSTGVAKSARLYAIKTTECGQGMNTRVLVDALDKALGHIESNRNWPAVVNFSIGTTGLAEAPTLERTVQRLTARGVHFVAAAGNFDAGADAVTPARLAQGTAVITVGAVNAQGNKVLLTAYGPALSLFAPGQNVLTAAMRSGSTGTGPLSDTALMSRAGTSFAAPHVAGVAALCLTAEPSLKPAELKARLQNCATENALSITGPGSPNRFLHSQSDTCSCSRGPSYSDLPGTHWAYPTVSCLQRLGVGFPTSASTFSPSQPMLRWEMAVMMVQAMGEAARIPVEPANYFDDVAVTAWWSGHVDRFRDLGVTAGCGTRRYCPNDPVRRWQLAVFLLNALSASTSSTHRGYFDDVPASHPYRAAIERLYELGISSGEVVSGRRYFRPDRETSRAEIAAFLRAASTVRSGVSRPFPQPLTCGA